MSSGNRTHRIVVSPGLLLSFVLAVNVIDAARLISKDGAVFMLNDIIPLAQHSRMIQRMINAGVDRIGNVLLPNVFDSHLRLIVGFAKRFSPLEKKYQVWPHCLLFGSSAISDVGNRFTSQPTGCRKGSRNWGKMARWGNLYRRLSTCRCLRCWSPWVGCCDYGSPTGSRARQIALRFANAQKRTV